ncbi:MAG: hypothetical protein Tsb0016_22100 [Sphingomonadales bacterium]
MREVRQRREVRGRRAERLARLFLWLKGYRCLRARYRSPVGEIDLICRRGRVLAFIEVKARPRLDDAAAAITPPQLARIRRASAHFLASQPGLAECDCRIDAVLVAPGRWPRHLQSIG